MEMTHDHNPDRTDLPSGLAKPQYEPPTITVMSDAEILTAFQITPAATTWWATM